MQEAPGALDMALLGSLNKPLMSSRGPLGKIIDMFVKGSGGGLLANVIDKEAAKGAISARGIPLPFLSALGPQPVTLNATDALALLFTNGLKMPSKGSIMAMAGVVLVKKLAEARDWIDPMDTNIPKGKTNVTVARENRMVNEITSYMPSFSGGLTHN